LKTILITNDDGFESAGLLALIKVLKPLARIITVAPASEKSACSHSVTLHEPLKLVEVSKDFYKLVDGTPSDCIYVSKTAIFTDFQPDLVVSGINRGSNMGEDITYSGTVAGAMEGVLQGIPSISISQVLDETNRKNVNYDLASAYIYKLVKMIFLNGFPLGDREILNINVPPKGKVDEVEITYAGYRIYGNDTHIYSSPRGEKLYWLGLHPLEWKKRGGQKSYSDFDAVFDNKISVTPIKLDLTAYEKIEALKNWI